MICFTVPGTAFWPASACRLRSQSNLRGKPHRRPALANEDGRNRNLQSVEKVGFEKPRHRYAATLDEDARTATVMEQTKCLRCLIAR